MLGRLLVRGSRPALRDSSSALRRAFPSDSAVVTATLRSSSAQAVQEQQPSSLLQAMRVPAGNMVRVVWDDHVASQYTYIWLRDNCQCSRCVDPATRHKLHDTPALPLDVQPSNVEFDSTDLTVHWSDGHKAVYPESWLRDHAEPFLVGGHSTFSSKASSKPAPGTVKGAYLLRDYPEPSPWLAEDLRQKPMFVDYAELTDADSAVSRRALRQLCDNVRLYGLAFLRGVPIVEDEVLRVAGMLTIPKETCYGSKFDVVQDPTEDVSHPAYSGAELDMHTDMNYREKSPGLQFLHCHRLKWLKSMDDIAADKRGLSIFVDGLAVSEHLKANDPAAFHLLSSTPVTFAIRYKECTYSQQVPIICEGSNGKFEEIHLNNRCMAPLQLPPNMIRPFYSAYKSLNTIVRDPAFRYTHQLQPGELVIFNNRRAMHGRTAYDPGSVDRKLQGCYGYLDEFLSKYRSVLDATTD